MSKPSRTFIKYSFPLETAQNCQFSSYLTLWGGSVATVTYTAGYFDGYADGQRIGSETLSVECGTEAMTLRIHRLKTKDLKIPFDILVEPDDDGFIAKTPDLPLYGFGDDRDEAISNLKAEIETLYDDLMADDNFSEEWLQIKAYLKERVIN